MLQHCSGIFKSGEGDGVSIRHNEEAGRLVLMMGSDELPLRGIGEDSFLFTQRNVDTFVRFIRNQAGEIIRFALGSRQLPKVEA